MAKLNKGTQNIKRQDRIFICLMLAYPFLQFAVFYVFLNFNSILMAFKTVKNGEIVFAGFDNFITGFNQLSGEAIFGVSVFNSIKTWILSFIISMPLYFLFSYYIFKGFFFGKTFRFITYVPNIISGMIMGLVFKKFVEDGLPGLFGEDFPLLLDGENSYWTCLFYSIWLSFGTNLLIYPNAMKAIDKEILESAELDGVNAFQEFTKIIFPLIFPTFTTFVVTGVAGIFSAGGPLLTFWKYDAPFEAYNVSYYITTQVMVVDSYAANTVIAAIGIIISIIVSTLALVVRHFMEKCWSEV